MSEEEARICRTPGCGKVLTYYTAYSDKKTGRLHARCKKCDNAARTKNRGRSPDRLAVRWAYAGLKRNQS